MKRVFKIGILIVFAILGMVGLEFPYALPLLPTVKISPVTLSSGTEGRVLYIEKLNGSDWLYVHFLNGTYRGKRGWLPFRQPGTKVRIYAVEKNQSYQTIELKNAQFARADADTQGFVDLLYENLSERSFEDDIREYTINFFDSYPRTNFGIENLDHIKGVNEACPKRPLQRSGAPCLAAPIKYPLPKYLLRAVLNAANKYNVHPAIIAAILQKESYFNPFIENIYEKNLCKEQKKNSEKCPEYKWGQGLAQMGATNAHEYGLEWQYKIPKIKGCGKQHIFKKQCFDLVEKRCLEIKQNTGFFPTYCPSASIQAVAQYISKLIQPEQWIRVDVKDSKGKWKVKAIDVSEWMRRNLAEEFRYILGMYNRGKRPINSIEEHFRQFGKAPEWYDYAWTTERKEGITPSTQIGYMILNLEMINRCHVWQVAGLCGESLVGTLAGAYLQDFPNWKKHPEKYMRSISSQTSDLHDKQLYENEDINLLPEHFEK